MEERLLISRTLLVVETLQTEKQMIQANREGRGVLARAAGLEMCHVRTTG